MRHHALTHGPEGLVPSKSDIDENNYITGKARFSGNVKVSESMGVDGFGGKSILDQKFANESIAADEMAVDYDSDSSEIADNFFNKNNKRF